ncbi:MAG: hypothetical protein CMJ58_04045 [Planctomycetaceae bacterium]|nr:hypothetical protein [Planctomycetaceae bacterium]
MRNKLCMLAALACFALAPAAQAQTYFFVGPAGGDFFDEANWNTMSDGTGSIPAGDPIQDSTTNAITLDLIIDGDTVEAAGEVDFGPGSLTLLTGSMLSITGAGNDLDINSDSTFSFTGATLEVNDIINFEGTSTFSGGVVTSVTDDIVFQNQFISLIIDGTTFNAQDTVQFEGPTPGSIANAVFNVVDQFGLRDDGDGTANVVMTNTSIDIDANGSTSGGDIQNVFSGDAIGSSLTLLGASTLRADAVEEGADLILGGTSVATLGVHFEERITADGSTITMLTPGAKLNVVALDNLAAEYVDSRPFLINGITGVDYATDPSTWNVTNWDGFSAVSLQIVPEPGTSMLALAGLALFGMRRRR